MSDLKNLYFEEMTDLIVSLGEKKYRAAQIFDWVHKKRISSIDEMSNLSKSFAETLKKECYISEAKTTKRLCSTQDDTIKYLFEMENQGIIDSAVIESVRMKQNYGSTVCVSSQAGCAMACAFCASTIGGKERDLTSGEMLSQVYSIEKDTGERVSNIVIMGSGEPLDNYENSIRFIRLINDERGANISQRSITLSTCGLIGGIERLMGENLQITLAISLHAPNDEIRNQIMPISRKNRFGDLMRICREYAETTKRRITFEYALIKGLNDSPALAAELARELRGTLCHVNIIPLNEVKGRAFEKPNKAITERFVSVLTKGGLSASVRKEHGADISAACGQLKNQR